LRIVGLNRSILTSGLIYSAGFTYGGRSLNTKYYVPWMTIVGTKGRSLIRNFIRFEDLVAKERHAGEDDSTAVKL